MCGRIQHQRTICITGKCAVNKSSSALQNVEGSPEFLLEGPNLRLRGPIRCTLVSQVHMHRQEAIAEL